MFNAKARISPARIQIELFDVIDVTESWTSREVVFERFHLMGRAFHQRFHAAIVKVLHVSHDLMTRGGALRKESIADALHVPADKKAACDLAGN